jgi:hypothetical protein
VEASEDEKSDNQAPRPAKRMRFIERVRQSCQIDVKSARSAPTPSAARAPPPSPAGATAAAADAHRSLSDAEAEEFAVTTAEEFYDSEEDDVFASLQLSTD